jgi:hypothetical protein
MAITLRRKEPGEEDALILDVLGFYYELAVTPLAVEVMTDSTLPGDHAERVAAVLDEIDVDWVEHFDWPVAIGARRGIAARHGLALVPEIDGRGNGNRNASRDPSPHPNGAAGC